MAFSWAEQLAKAKKMLIRQAIQQANAPTKSFKVKHPDWCRDAVRKDYTKLKIDVEASFKKHVDLYDARRKKQFGN